MKSQRRHELQTNELADAIGRAVTRLRPHAQTAAIVAGAVVIAVVVLVSLPLMQSRAAVEAAAAFNAAVRSGGAEPVRTFLDAHPEAEQAVPARLLLADRLLQNVATGRVEDDEASAVLEEAEALYAQVAEGSKDLEPMARTGLALVILQRGDLDAGRKALETVVETYPTSVAAAKAEAHLDALAGYEPVAFSDEPLEQPVDPDAVPQGAEEVGETGAEEVGETGAEEAGPAAETPAAPAEGAEAPAEPPSETGEETPAGETEEPSRPVG
jgi:predicted negative regulator of RcsB-dependent stress response